MKAKYNRFIFFLIFSLIIAVSFNYPMQIKAASSGTYVEDFTTTSYLDTSNTNAIGWGSGEVELPRQNPQYLDSIDIGVSNHLFIEGGRAYVGTSNGLFIIDITNPSSLNLIGYYNDSVEIDWLYGCVVQNQLAYLANGNDGLFIVNVTDLSNPTKKGELDLPSVSSDIKLKNQYAYIPVYSGGIRVVDVTDPTAPSDVSGYIPTASDAYGVAISGDYIYVAVSHQGLESFSITSPTTPSHLDTVDLAGYAKKVEIKGNYAYVACDLGGLQIVDISDPTNMTRVAWLDDNTRYYGVCVENNFVYVSGVISPSGYIMKIYDISDPTNPIPAGFYSLSNTGYDVFVDGDYAYCAATTLGLQSFQIAETGDYYANHYDNYAVARSNFVYIPFVGEYLERVTLTVSDSQPLGTNIDYFVSSDGGSNWEACTPGMVHYFTNTGRYLKWMAELTTVDDDLTPSITSLSMDHHTADEVLIPVYPVDGSYIPDISPNLDWGDIPGAPGYWIQLSTSATFNTFLVNETLFMTESNYTVLTPLSEGKYYWRVGYFIEFSTFGEFSDTWSFNVGDEPVVPEFRIVSLSLLILSMFSVSVIILNKRQR
ncbi:MAG: hypothetical protein H7641_10195 [Candidatus Heimdallarchaeota archaeon]|nr:hypothetical protein [Candidatus Heimdallarchaeota archaeon]MCK4877932.1 hypothetical protein [Candidatus Heimdallarchaeota archaeon]